MESLFIQLSGLNLEKLTLMTGFVVQGRIWWFDAQEIFLIINV